MRKIREVGGKDDSLDDVSSETCFRSELHFALLTSSARGAFIIFSSFWSHLFSVLSRKAPFHHFNIHATKTTAILHTVEQDATITA